MKYPCGWWCPPPCKIEHSLRMIINAVVVIIIIIMMFILIVILNVINLCYHCHTHFITCCLIVFSRPFILFSFCFISSRPVLAPKITITKSWMSDRWWTEFRSWFRSASNGSIRVCFFWFFTQVQPVGSAISPSSADPSSTTNTIFCGYFLMMLHWIRANNENMFTMFTMWKIQLPYFSPFFPWNGYNPIPLLLNTPIASQKNVEIPIHHGFVARGCYFLNGGGGIHWEAFSRHKIPASPKIAPGILPCQLQEGVHRGCKDALVDEKPLGQWWFNQQKADFNIF